MVFALESEEAVAADGEEPGGEAFDVAIRGGFGETEEGVLDGIAGGFEVGAEGSGEGEEGALEAVEGGEEPRAVRGGGGRGGHG